MALDLLHSSLPICGFPQALPAQLERGTPIENKVDELHSIFDFVNYGYLGDQERPAAL